MTYCKDCHFVERGFFGTVKSFARCLHPSAQHPYRLDFVSGKTIKQLPEYAATMRIEHGDCGPDAKLYLQHTPWWREDNE